ncbi:MAG: glycosyl transferase, group 1 [Acidimicrobiales bacterium]|nr:glycosyl transferase, group 1 [Acidimicrobiales bacterium]
MTSRRRVAVTLEQLWHRVPGGTATAAIGMVRALAARGDLELVGVAARHGAPPPAAFAAPTRVEHLPLPRPALYEAWHALRWPPVQMATGPVDVVHATAVAMPPKRSPLVITIHDLAFLTDVSHATRHGHRFFRRGTELARRDADLVLCSSRATVADCVAAGFRPERLRHVPLGHTSVPASEADVARVRRVHALLRPYVLFVGTVEPRKNLGAVLDAFADLGDVDVDLVLVGPEGWNEDLDARLQALGPRARRLGFVPNDDLPGLYAGAAVFCYPSLQEGFGLPILEAMAQGTPVVTSLGTSTAEVAADAGVLVDPRDPAAITAALRSVLDDPQRAADLRARGLVRAATCTWERTAELVAAAYAEVAP